MYILPHTQKMITLKKKPDTRHARLSKLTKLYTLKWVHFIICKLSISKVDLKKKKSKATAINQKG